VKKIFSLLIAFTLLFSSFSVASAKSTAAVTKQKTHFTGKDIFLGAVLGQGKFAKKFKPLWVEEQYKHNNSQEAIDATAPLIEEMEKMDPTYFDSLEAAVYNEDFVETKNLLDEGSSVLLKLFEEESSEARIGTGDTVEPNAIIAYLAIAIGVVVVYSHAGLLTFYLYAAAVGPGFKSADSQFDNDQLIYTVIDSVQ
jgi:SdpC family antimicrobial peptide